MRFNPDLLDGADPLYAPGLSFSKRTAVWKAPRRYADAGYQPKSVNLNLPGAKDDDRARERAALCRQYTRDMLAWWADQDRSEDDFGTWGYLIRRYRTDDASPYQSVKQNTREGYDYTLRIWSEIIEPLKIKEMTFEKIKAIEKAMRDEGKSDSHIHRMFNMLRGLANYGSLVEATSEPATRVAFVLSKIRFRQPAPRSVHPTRDQVEAIVAAADAGGAFAWATGILVQYEFMLRAVDVRGQWLRDDGQGGIARNGRRWQDGLTWEMFDRDLTRFEKVISKTRRSMPEPYTFNLSGVPYLRDRIARLRPQSPVGPVFVSREGLPYDQTSWTRLWADYRDAAGVPKNVKMMDLRAGAITEARNVGATDFTLRDAAQHSDVSTTSRYVRGRSDAASNVVQMRQSARGS